MSVHETALPAEEKSPRRRVDYGQYGLAGFLVVIGIYTIIDASGLEVGFADPVGPRVFPYVIGTGLVLVGVLLAVATARGSQPEPEDGEDVDLSQSADWLTVLKLVAVLLFTVATVNLLGWAISGAVLFAGAAWSLGSRTLVRDVLVGLVLAIASWYAFYVGLGIPLTPGVLDGIL
ncbi:tripartite tricarboxylate transporter TctB family protein [Nocardioides albus]|uniref:Putative tricarboxylic transport membrane protein n=1 Tax=Nocardioides albus TaxID=1841 RepID=A0A7W5A576_9ACTN|nr:tripartite tricarboxylate transporter TctB family protein [Nocardioides albus]MBB3089674.1 putative tricarboxylic transport membrane protein [Nocardioides albus]GGU30169.1 membrane protein [Nocardioides albus]